MMHLLWTDTFFLGMIFIILFAVFFSLRKEPARLVIKRLLAAPIAISSGIIFSFFLFIAILDSLHITIQNKESMTILDSILSPLNNTYEKTYSAPLALNLYTKETISESGKIKQVYSKLLYTGSIDLKQKEQIIFNSFLQALAQTACVGFILLALYFLLNYFRKRQIFSLSMQFLTGFITFLSCLFFAVLAYKLSRYFHLFGTGKIGQDIFYYAVKSIRTGLVIGTVTTLFMLPLGIILGIIAGYFGGVIDDIIQYIYTVLSSIPGVLLITASVLSMQTYIANHPAQFPTLEKNADARLLALCLILGITSWTSLCRLLRAEALKFREIDFVLAAKALGSGTFHIIWKHLLPNMMPIVLTTVVLDFSFLVLAEAVLSYVGVGVSPLTISWGNMINGARLELAREPMVWWPMFAAFLLMFILVLASNLLADEVREALIPD